MSSYDNPYQMIPAQSSMPTEVKSPRSWIVTLLFALLAGYWGVHRLYAGKFWTGLLMFLTGGGFGLWWLIDVILVALSKFRDSEGRLITATEPSYQQQLPYYQPQHQHTYQPPHQHQHAPPGYQPGHVPYAGQPPQRDEEYTLADLDEDPLEAKFAELEREMKQK